MAKQTRKPGVHRVCVLKPRVVFGAQGNQICDGFNRRLVRRVSDYFCRHRVDRQNATNRQYEQFENLPPSQQPYSLPFTREFSKQVFQTYLFLFAGLCDRIQMRFRDLKLSKGYVALNTLEASIYFA